MKTNGTFVQKGNQSSFPVSTGNKSEPALWTPDCGDPDFYFDSKFAAAAEEMNATAEWYAQQEIRNNGINPFPAWRHEGLNDEFI